MLVNVDTALKWTADTGQQLPFLAFLVVSRYLGDHDPTRRSIISPKQVHQHFLFL